MAFQGHLAKNSDVNLHNADSTTGRKPAADSATVNLANEDLAVLNAIAAGAGVPVQYLTETTLTADAFIDMRPVNGDFNTDLKRNKEFVIKNVGVNNARVNVLGSVDGTNFDISIVNNSLLASGNTLEIAENERVFIKIRVEARANTAGQQTSILSRGYAI